MNRFFCLLLCLLFSACSMPEKEGGGVREFNKLPVLGTTLVFENSNLAERGDVLVIYPVNSIDWRVRGGALTLAAAAGVDNVVICGYFGWEADDAQFEESLRVNNIWVKSLKINLDDFEEVYKWRRECHPFMYEYAVVLFDRKVRWRGHVRTLTPAVISAIKRDDFDFLSREASRQQDLYERISLLGDRQEACIAEGRWDDAFLLTDRFCESLSVSDVAPLS